MNHKGDGVNFCC